MPEEKDSLQEYHRKRDFNKTPEPNGTPFAKHKKPIFVIQEHHARRLHFDLRLEWNGVLKSWALPKGIPHETGEKRLAIETEDHPLSYASFEGSIPAGNYGAGTVDIFDEGTYDNLKNYSMQTAYNNGELVIRLYGKEVQGEFALIKTDYEPNSWLLIKLEPKS